MKVKINVFRKKMEEYFSNINEYNSFNFIKKFFCEKPVRPEMFHIGNRYMVKYGDISASIMNVFYNGNMYEYRAISPLNSSQEIDSLYTIVEYVGDGKFLDLTSGQVFGVCEINNSGTITNTFTEQANLQKRLLEYPLSITLNNTENASELNLKIDEVSAAVNSVVSRYSEQDIEKIILYLNEKKSLALKAVEQSFEVKEAADDDIEILEIDEPISNDEPLEIDEPISNYESEVKEEAEDVQGKNIPQQLTAEDLNEIREEFMISGDKPIEKGNSK